MRPKKRYNAYFVSPQRLRDISGKEQVAGGTVKNQKLPRIVQETIGLDYDKSKELEEQTFLLGLGKRGTGLNNMHELTHLSDSDLQQGKPKFDKSVKFSNLDFIVKYATSLSEIEANFNEVMLFILSRKNPSFPSYVSHTTREILKVNREEWALILRMKAILWNKIVTLLKEGYTIQDIVKNKSKIVHNTSSDVMQKVLPAYLMAYLGDKYSIPEIKSFIINLRDDIPAEQIDNFLNTFEDYSDKNWLPEGIEKELEEFNELFSKNV